MDTSTQAKKATRFRQLHQGPEILVLPNVWDALGARLLVHQGYPAVATASAAVAFSHGYDDGEHIPFETLLQAVRHITRVVDVPVSVDMERGYAERITDLQDNVRELLNTGAVGINLEDSFEEGGRLRSIADQCARIQAVHEAAHSEGVPLFINARTDVFLSAALDPDVRLAQAIERGRDYKEAGADGLYPIGLFDREALREMHSQVDLPLNVYASAQAPDAATLQADGMARLSLGPGMLRAAFATMQRVAQEMREHGRSESVIQAGNSGAIRTVLGPGN